MPEFIFNGKFQTNQITEKEPYYLLPDVTEVVVVVAVVVVVVAVVVVVVPMVVVVVTVPAVVTDSIEAVDTSETEYLHIRLVENIKEDVEYSPSSP